ncbi:MAG: pyrroline-5-carboxylate reductase [Candidatus Aphodosoma sp.]
MKIGFIGFGNMAQAIARGLVRSGAVLPENIGASARDWDKLYNTAAAMGCKAFKTSAETVEFADTVFIAVKPYLVEEVLNPLKNALTGKILVSIAAGWTHERYMNLLQQPSAAVLCTVPNTPVAVCEGIIVCERRHSLSPAQHRTVSRLLESLGMVIEVDTRLLGISGTVCGCGPAYTAMFIEALADAAVKHGIPRADAYKMASQMIAGTARLQIETGQHPGIMKDAVCSPGGTTIKGIAALEHAGFRSAVISAVDASESK